MDPDLSTSDKLGTEITFALSLVQHHPTHILHINHILSLKELNNLGDEFFFRPDEDEAVYHEGL